MPIYNMTSNDTATLNGHVFNDLTYDDVTVLNFPNELVKTRTGKNGNTIFSQDATGFNCSLTLKIIRGSSDDAFMSGLIAAAPADFPSTELLNGTFVKRLGDGGGNVVSDVYTLQGGVISKIPDGKENTSGDTAQGEAIYMIKFAAGNRVLG